MLLDGFEAGSSNAVVVETNPLFAAPASASEQTTVAVEQGEYVPVFDFEEVVNLEANAIGEQSDASGSSSGGPYNTDGFNAAGFNAAGFNAEGFNADGFNAAGFNAAGFNAEGFNAEGFNAEGFNAEGFNAEGFNAEGFNADGFNAEGFNAEGFNADGFNAAGFNAEGYDIRGFNADGFDVYGFNADGFNAAGIPRDAFNSPLLNSSLEQSSALGFMNKFDTMDMKLMTMRDFSVGEGLAPIDKFEPQKEEEYVGVEDSGPNVVGGFNPLLSGSAFDDDMDPDHNQARVRGQDGRIAPGEYAPNIEGTYNPLLDMEQSDILDRETNEVFQSMANQMKKHQFEGHFNPLAADPDDPDDDTNAAFDAMKSELFVVPLHAPTIKQTEQESYIPLQGREVGYLDVGDEEMDDRSTL